MTVVSISGSARTQKTLAQTSPRVSPAAGSFDLPEALRQKIDDSIAAMFVTPPDHRLTIDDQIATGAFPAEIEAMRRPIIGLDRREGALIESAIRYWLLTSSRFVARESVSTEIYRASFDLIDANRAADAKLDLRLKLTGPAVDSLAIDVIAIDRATHDVLLVEVKRSSIGVTESRIRALKAAAYTVKERLIGEGIPVARVLPTIVAWWGEPTPSLVSRATIDDHFGSGVRALVDAVIHRYRTGIATAFTARWGSDVLAPIEAALATPANVTATARALEPIDDRLGAALASLDRQRRKASTPANA